MSAGTMSLWDLVKCFIGYFATAGELLRNLQGSVKGREEKGGSVWASIRTDADNAVQTFIEADGHPF